MQLWLSVTNCKHKFYPLAVFNGVLLKWTHDSFDINYYIQIYISQFGMILWMSPFPAVLLWRVLHNSNEFWNKQKK